MSEKISTALDTVSAEDMYQDYVKGLLKDNKNLRAKKFSYVTNGIVFDVNTNEVYITYKQFKEILSTYNQLAGDKIVEGYAWKVGAQLGDMFVARIERPANSRKLDRQKSFKRRKELKEAGLLTKDNWQVPYTDDDFIMVMWHKGNGQLRNIHLYKFKTAGGQPGKGFKAKVSGGVRRRPELKALYPYLPSKKLVPTSELPKKLNLKENGI